MPGRTAHPELREDHVRTDSAVTELTGPATVGYRRQTVGVVFQAFNLIPSLSARGNVVVPMRLARVRVACAKQRANELLHRVGLSARATTARPRCRGANNSAVAIARALVHDPPLVLADEPTAHLDHIQVEGILRLLRDLAAGADRDRVHPRRPRLPAGRTASSSSPRTSRTRTASPKK